MTRTGRGLAITDNNLLVNFVDAGRGDLLQRHCGGPVLISPSVIEPTEHVPFPSQPTSEFNVIIYKAQLAAIRRARQLDRGEDPEPVNQMLDRRAAHRVAFLRMRGNLWEGIELTEEDARHRYALQHDPRLVKLKRRQADAECLSLAQRRGLTLLTDDQPVVDAARLLQVPTMRTCALLVEMVTSGLLTPDEAAHLFNDIMVTELGFTARRMLHGQRERLVLTPDPLECRWVPWP